MLNRTTLLSLLPSLDVDARFLARHDSPPQQQSPLVKHLLRNTAAWQRHEKGAKKSPRYSDLFAEQLEKLLVDTRGHCVALLKNPSENEEKKFSLNLHGRVNLSPKGYFYQPNKPSDDAQMKVYYYDDEQLINFLETFAGRRLHNTDYNFSGHHGASNVSALRADFLDNSNGVRRAFFQSLSYANEELSQELYQLQETLWTGPSGRAAKRTACDITLLLEAFVFDYYEDMGKSYSQTRSSRAYSFFKPVDYVSTPDSKRTLPNFLYHYTSKDKLELIQASQFLKVSNESEGRSLYGDGAYFTSLRPDLWDLAEISTYTGANNLDAWIELSTEQKIKKVRARNNEDPTVIFEHMGYKLSSDMQDRVEWSLRYTFSFARRFDADCQLRATSEEPYITGGYVEPEAKPTRESVLSGTKPAKCPRGYWIFQLPKGSSEHHGFCLKAWQHRITYGFDNEDFQRLRARVLPEQVIEFSEPSEVSAILEAERGNEERQRALKQFSQKEMMIHNIRNTGWRAERDNSFDPANRFIDTYEAQNDDRSSFTLEVQNDDTRYAFPSLTRAKDPAADSEFQKNETGLFLRYWSELLVWRLWDLYKNASRAEKTSSASNTANLHFEYPVLVKKISRKESVSSKKESSSGTAHTVHAIARNSPQLSSQSSLPIKYANFVDEQTPGCDRDELSKYYSDYVVGTTGQTAEALSQKVQESGLPDFIAEYENFQRYAAIKYGVAVMPAWQFMRLGAIGEKETTWHVENTLVYLRDPQTIQKYWNPTSSSRRKTLLKETYWNKIFAYAKDNLNIDHERLLDTDQEDALVRLCREKLIALAGPIDKHFMEYESVLQPYSQEAGFLKKAFHSPSHRGDENACYFESKFLGDEDISASA